MRLPSTQGTGSWQLEYQQAAATDCAPQHLPDLKWSGSLQEGASADPCHHGTTDFSYADGQRGQACSDTVRDR